MILPTKHIRPDRALIGVGSEVLAFLQEPKTASRLWDEFRAARNSSPGMAPVTYDWFVLSVNLLFMIGAVDVEGTLIKRQTRQQAQVKV
jgi:hypothetical protein